MARAPRKKKDLNQVGGAGNLSHSPKNELTDDQRHALTLQHKTKYVSGLSQKKKAAADFLNVTKLIKAELGDDGLADIKDMIASESEDFEPKLVAELERKARLARWVGLELGAQGSLFESHGTRSQGEIAFDEGKRAGLAGEICKPSYSAGTDGYDGYMRGWHEGAAVKANMASEQKEGETILMRPAGNEPAGEDAFDKAADGGDNPAAWPDDKAVAEREAEPA